MPKMLIVMLAGVVLVASRPATAAAQKPEAPTPITLTGCVSAKPGASGQYVLSDADGISRYQLKGRRLNRFAGMRVEVVGGTSGGGGVAVRGGLVGPLAGARGTALDPSQESVKRQPGGGGTGVGPSFPEFRVSRVKAVGGAACEEPPAR